MDTVLNRPLFAGKVSADPSGAISRQYRQPSIRPAGLPSLSDYNAGDRSLLFSNALLAAAEEEVQMAQDRFENDPSGVNQQLYADAVSKFEAAQKESEDVNSTYLPGPVREIKTRGILDVEGPEAAVSLMSPEQLDIFNSLERAAENPDPEAPTPEAPTPEAPTPKVNVPGAPILGRSEMETEARDSRPRSSILPPDPTQPVDPMGRSTMEADARDRGPLIGDPAAVAAGLNAEDLAVRERTLEDFMKEFTDAAPKYEGPDKGLLLAQIGFAIAAGESPNAMQNIANGLLAGSNMMLKDKASKDEFNRQIQLSAMQYGLENKAQDRALGREFTNYVASGDVKYRGKTYGAGESVPVIHSDIINGRMPDGLVSESLSDAMTVRDTALRKSLFEAEKNKTLTAEQYRASITDLDKAASSFSMARNTIPLIEASIIRNADGKITGITSALTTAVNQAATAVGVDLEGLDSAEAYNSAMQTVAARMVQDILGEAGNNISNVDRELVANIVGVANGGYGNMFKDPDVLNAKLQEILQQAESKQQSALDTYNTLMEGLGGTYTPSGTPFRSMKAERVFNPSEPERAFTYDITEDGKYVKKYLGGGQ